MGPRGWDHTGAEHGTRSSDKFITRTSATYVKLGCMLWLPLRSAAIPVPAILVLWSIWEEIPIILCT